MDDRSTPGWLNTASLVLAGLSLVLVLVNAGLVLTNQTMQADVAGRAQFINQSAQLGQVNTALVRALATSAVNNKDDRLGDLLAKQGITYRVTPNANPTGTAGAGIPTPKLPPKP